MVAAVIRASRASAHVLLLSALGVLAFGGCSSIVGLDGIQEQACAPHCGTDASSSSSGSDVDSMAGDSAMIVDSTSNLDSTQADTGSSSGTSGSSSGTSGSSSGGDSSMGEPDAAKDTGTAVDTGTYDDAPFDSGCGSLNTTANCGSCGIKCASVGASQNSAQCCSGAMCPGSTNGNGDTCSYTCTTGHLDCNALTPPDSDGCECPYSGVTTAPSCCADQCPTQHSDGLVGGSYPNPTFYDCEATGAMDQQLALDACGAYVTAKGGSQTANCALFGPVDGGPPDSVCAIVTQNCGMNCTGFANDCNCWIFSGTFKGMAFDPKAAGAPDAQCYVPNPPAGPPYFH